MADPGGGSLRDKFRIAGVLPDPSDSNVTQFPLTAFALGNPGYFNTIRAAGENEHRDVYNMTLQEIEQLIRQREQETLKEIGAWHLMSSLSGYTQCDLFTTAIGTPLDNVQSAVPVPASDSIVIPDDEDSVPFGAFVDGIVQLLTREGSALTEQEGQDLKKRISGTARKVREYILQWHQAGTQLPMLRAKLSGLLLERRAARDAKKSGNQPSNKIDDMTCQVWALVAKMVPQMQKKPKMEEMEFIRNLVTTMMGCDG